MGPRQSGQKSAERIVTEFFIKRMEKAGFDSDFGYDRPNLGRAVGKNNKPQCEIWLGDGRYVGWANNVYPLEVEDSIKAFIWMHKGTSHVPGSWYDVCSDAVQAIAHNAPERNQGNHLGWDSRGVTINRTSPLQMWDGSLEDSASFLCALIELPIGFQTTITEDILV